MGDLGLPNLLLDLDEAGFSGVICNETQVKRVDASAEGSHEIISHARQLMTRYSSIFGAVPLAGLTGCGM